MSGSYRLTLFPQAVADLIRLREFIREHNPAAANRSSQKIRAAFSKLRSHPFLGHKVCDIDVAGLRDLFVPFGQGGYKIRYRVQPGEIQIIKIWHAKEDR
ncbi:MAG: type II toxin-antitoxin system RelE/ParE family toxin [Pseudomonadota bacterium]